MRIEIFEKPTDSVKVALIDSGCHIEIVIVDTYGRETSDGHLLALDKETGRVTLFDGIDDEAGLDLNGHGRLKVTNFGEC